jgi:uncharacterized Zn-binding protein involved in type VI secretion
MPGITRVNKDTAGAVIIESLEPSVYVNGYNVALLGCLVKGHGGPPHSSPVMAEASSTVFAGGIAVCRSGDAASCGDLATGSDDVNAAG